MNLFGISVELSIANIIKSHKISTESSLVISPRLPISARCGIFHDSGAPRQGDAAGLLQRSPGGSDAGRGASCFVSGNPVLSLIFSVGKCALMILMVIC